MTLREIALACSLLALQRPVVAKEVKPRYEPLSQADIIKSMQKYTFYKMSVPPVYDSMGGWTMLFGVTDYANRSVGTNSMLTDKQAYQVFLHEERHIYNEERGLPQREDWVREFACKDYELFFKEKCPDQNNLEDAIRWEYR